MFHAVHAANAPWSDLVAECLAGLDASATPNLGFIYITEALAPNLDDILARLRAVTPITEWVGSVGLGICAGGHEYFEQPAMAILFGDLPTQSFRILRTITTENDARLPEHDDWLDGDRPPFAILHADTNNDLSPRLVEGLAETTSGFLVGGLTTSTYRDHQIAGGPTGGGVSGVLFSPDVEVATALSQGCSPIGEIHTITKASDNILVSLDGRSAFEVFGEEIGEVLLADLNRAAGYIHAALPVAGSDTGDYVVRNLVGADRDRGLVAIAAEVEAGDRVLFVRRDPQSAKDDLVAMLGRLKDRVGGAPKAGIYVSCVARGPQMFGANDVETGLINNALTGVPLIGFYANGEISNNRLYAYTGVLTLFL